MATFTAIKNRGGGRGALGGVLRYTQQDEKRCGKDSGWCQAGTAPPSPPALKCNSQRSGSGKQMGGSITTSSSPSVSRTI